VIMASAFRAETSGADLSKPDDQVHGAEMVA
jgi:hypothetical protein